MKKNSLLSIVIVSMALFTAQAYSEPTSSTRPTSWRCPPDQTCTAQEILCPPATPPSKVSYTWEEINRNSRQYPTDPHTIRCTASCKCMPARGPAISCEGLGMLGNQTCDGSINSSNSTIFLTPAFEFTVDSNISLNIEAELTCMRWIQTIPVSVCEQACEDNLMFSRTCYTSVPNPNWMNEGCDGPRGSDGTPYCENHVAP